MLLNQPCRICHQTGHTATYCSQYRPQSRDIGRDREESAAPEKKRNNNDDNEWVQVAPRVRNERRVPYAHPHGPRVRLALESRALSYAFIPVAEPVAEPVTEPVTEPVDIRTIDLQHSSIWSEEEPYLMTEYMFRQLTKTANENENK